VTVHREQSVKREYQQDATIQMFIVNFRCSLLTTSRFGYSLYTYVPVTVHREQSVKREYQQDATIQMFIVNFRCSLLTTSRFGYSRLFPRPSQTIIH